MTILLKDLEAWLTKASQKVDIKPPEKQLEKPGKLGGSEKKLSESSDMPDPYSIDMYEWVDDTIQKTGLVIPGKHPRGSKKVGKQIEADLYYSLRDKINDYISSIPSYANQNDVINGVTDIVHSWQETMSGNISQAFEDIYIKGVVAGILDAGVRPTMGVADKLAMEFVKDNPNRIGERIVLFSEEIIEKFRPIISESYGPEGEFDVNALVGKMKKVVNTQRYKLERIARTETANVSGAGRFIGWSKDPDRYTYNYFWRNTIDNRSKPISLWRGKQNPLTFSEALYLWEHQTQNMGGKIGLQSDMYNQRCTVSRSPRDELEDYKGNRWEGDINFVLTMSLGIIE